MNKYMKMFYNAAKLNLSYLSKSKSNLYFTFLTQVFYYIAQLIFWSGIINVNTNQFTSSNVALFGFLVTLSFVDNYYLLFFGSGSLKMQQLILKSSLDNFLLKPVHPLVNFIFLYPNFGHLGGVFISSIMLLSYYIYFKISIILIIIHIMAMILGIGILNGISFIYRISCFWTKSIVSIKNSNPSFKIMVRPLDAFTGKLRFFLIFCFPALFITGIPSQIIAGTSCIYWIFGCFLANIWVWIIVFLLWNMGVKRYCLKCI